MKVYIAAYDPIRTGGGWSFSRSLAKGLGDLFTTDYSQADIFFVSGASMLKPEEAEKAKSDGKYVVLRVDNALKHSRNQGKGMARMQRIAIIADLVVYQCQWAKDYLDEFLGKPKSVIIYNGVDLDVFKPEGDKIDFGHHPVYLYASAAKGENKGWDNAWHDYQRQQKKEPKAMLLIAGKVSTEVINHGFDFFQDENYRYLGMIDSAEKMAIIYRSSDYMYAVFMNDCYSNAILEAAMCGVKLISVSMTGGTPELIENIKKGREYNGIGRMVNDYKDELEKL